MCYMLCREKSLGQAYEPTMFFIGKFQQKNPFFSSPTYTLQGMFGPPALMGATHPPHGTAWIIYGEASISRDRERGRKRKRRTNGKKEKGGDLSKIWRALHLSFLPFCPPCAGEKGQIPLFMVGSVLYSCHVPHSQFQELISHERSKATTLPGKKISPHSTKFWIAVVLWRSVGACMHERVLLLCFY